MHKYLLKRLLSLIPVLFVVSLAIFLLIHLVPCDPAAAILIGNYILIESNLISGFCIVSIFMKLQCDIENKLFRQSIHIHPGRRSKDK